MAAALATQAHAQTKQYGPGVTDTEIKIGQTMPFSGPASAYSQLSRAEQAYFKSLNDKGGINGRKVVLIALDDGYSPPKSLEATRRLVESEEVAAIFGTLGTANNLASRAYLNKAKVPQLFVAGGSQAFNDPARFPWTMGWQPTLHREGVFYGREVARRSPAAKVGVLYQNDDFGKELLAGLKEGLGPDADQRIVSAQSFQATDPTVDSQIVLLKDAGADTLFLFTYAKQAAQAIRKTHEMGWRPTTYLTLGSAYIGSTFKPAGLEASKGILTGGFIKEATDPRWADDPDVKAWFQWMKEYMPGADLTDTLNIVGYAYAKTMEQVLRQCGDDLTRENILKQAANLKDVRIGVLIPGSIINTSPTDYNVVEYIKLQRFNGTSWDEVE
ncbi:ABC transporter substrate-binding protein [Chelatococcus reniformis]|uniref:ABC transporter substrate-binding protein n=1 Tax=Chelatococcus reniformis TaxID=1494448 RepID=UPI0027E43BB1|nr:ABC transporter substrate-binding protein [Chelatococcus reniformis]